MKNNPIIGIVGGKGVMGRLFAEFFNEREIKTLISDLDTKLSNKDLAQKADIVIISVPIDKTIKVIEKILPYLKKGSAITDFTSVKEKPVKAMLKAKSGIEIFGMHPMFGNSNPIPGQTVIMCPTKKSGKWYEWMKNFLEKNGAVTKIMTPQAHDRMMAVAQDLIHFVEITCAEGLRLSGIPVKTIIDHISKASELKIMSSARILDQDAGLYGNMQIENPYNLKFLNDYKKTVEELIKIIEKKDLKAFEKYFTKTSGYFGKYTHEAYKDSSFLIDKLIENRNRAKANLSSKNKEKPTKNHIALLGPKYTFSDIAARHTSLLSSCASSSLKKYYTGSITEIFELVEKGAVGCGIAPLENKLDGSVRETLDQLFLKKVHISDSFSFKINHCLVILPLAKKEDIKKIISHEQAINQCQNYLKKNFSQVQKESYSSTASAIEKLVFSNDKSIAVIASKQAAQAHDLKIFAENIEDDNTNSTSFIIIRKGNYMEGKASARREREQGEQSGFASCELKRALSNKTSIAFHFDKDSPGSLFSVLEDFAQAHINLTKIESRPTRKEFGDYIFYLDFEGTPKEKKIASILQTLTKKVAGLKVLGTL